MPDLRSEEAWGEFEKALLMISAVYPIAWRVVTITNEDGDILGRYVLHGMVF